MAQDVYRREALRLKESRSLVAGRFPRFGVNKQRETVRLLYEISKREGKSPAKALGGIEGRTFAAVKSALLARRYPSVIFARPPARFHLPRLDLREEAVANEAVDPFHPRRIVAEDAVADSALVRRFRSAFPAAEFSRVESLRFPSAPVEAVERYNRRRETAYIVRESFDFLKDCPCTIRAVSCGYRILNLGFGCPLDCSYCFLQGYSNAPGLIFPANIEDFFSCFSECEKSRPAFPGKRGEVLRLGTGEFSDSLALDRYTGYSPSLVEFFREKSGCLFEFKTKTAEVDGLLRARHGGNIVVGWSVNPERMIGENEFGSASLAARLAAAGRCAEAGYRLAFHFDPILLYAGWEREYGGVVEALADAVPPEKVAWISLGTLRFPPDLKTVIEKRFPGNTILDGELVVGFDGKLRYPDGDRLRAYRILLEALKIWSPRLRVYLCMESAAMWKKLGLPFPFGEGPGRFY
jgi:spore photoproduct lyase